MKLINKTPYNTMMLRKVITVVWRNYNFGGSERFKGFKVHVLLSGAKSKFANKHVLRLPKLNGTEWFYIKQQESHPEDVSTLREGIPNGDGPPLIWDVACRACQMLGVIISSVALTQELQKAKLPRFLTLKPIKEKMAPPDPVRKRYANVLKLERSWVRKSKLAATKLKKLRQQRRYYERRLA